MNIRLFYHSLVSDWNNGSAHFLRGIATELLALGHSVRIYEPANGWSRKNLVASHGTEPLRRFRAMYPQLESVEYFLASIDLDAELAEADLVIVHEWNDPDLLRRVAAAQRPRDCVVLFHDTHHRLATEPEAVGSLPLSGFDGVLACGEALRRLYLAEGLVDQAWTWHEAVDTRIFQPLPAGEYAGDVVWVGNWGDDEQGEEMREFLIEPVQELGLATRVYGVRFPPEARAELAAAGVEYGGWLPNFEVPAVLSQFRVTVHIPSRPYSTALPGIPTIRLFEAMACGLPIVTSPWDDAERLFTEGSDYLVARDGNEMCRHLKWLLADRRLRRQMATHQVEAIRTRHTCAHRADELLEIHRAILHGRQRAAELADTIEPAGRISAPHQHSR